MPTATQAPGQPPTWTGSLMSDLLGNWYVLGAILDASPAFRGLAVWERETDKQTVCWKDLPYGHQGGYWGALRSSNIGGSLVV